VNLDKYFARSYDDSKYNCLHFSSDVWYELTGEDIRACLEGLLNPRARHLKPSHIKAFEKLDKPSDPCLVLMVQPRREYHVGVFVGRKLLHIQAKGVEYLPLDVATRGFSSLRYYR
jgi:hypothetical protein